MAGGGRCARPPGSGPRRRDKPRRAARTLAAVASRANKHAPRDTESSGGKVSCSRTKMSPACTRNAELRPRPIAEMPFRRGIPGPTPVVRARRSVRFASRRGDWRSSRPSGRLGRAWWYRAPIGRSGAGERFEGRSRRASNSHASPSLWAPEASTPPGARPFPHVSDPAVRGSHSGRHGARLVTPSRAIIDSMAPARDRAHAVVLSAGHPMPGRRSWWIAQPNAPRTPEVGIARPVAAGTRPVRAAE
jgi:hypothetical protein